MKNFPNVLSISRIAISISLVFLVKAPTLFIIGYLLCGITDILDGYLARRYHWESSLGAQLDTLGDFVFFMVIIYLLLFNTDLLQHTALLSGIILVFIIRFVNFLITRIKFKTYGILHSWGNKLTGILLYLYVLMVFAMQSYPVIPSILIWGIALLSSLEELCILYRMEQYEVNTKTFLNITKEENDA